MTDRERLIELHEEAGVEWDYYVDECINEGKVPSKTYDEFHADYLLASGVIVPPCRCKDCTYLRESDTTNRMFCTYHGDNYEFETFPNNYCSNGVGIVKGA